MLKNNNVVYFCHLKKLVRPETFGPYYVEDTETFGPYYVEDSDIKSKQTNALDHYVTSQRRTLVWRQIT